VWMLQADTLDAKVLAVRIGFSTVVFAPLLALEVTYRFVHERRLLRGWLLLAVLVVPVITAILAWTINESPIFRYNFRIDSSGPVPLLRFERGPWNAVFYLYTYVLAIWSGIILLRGLHLAPPWVRRARILFFIARFIPMAFEVMFHFETLPPAGMNYGPASVALSDILLAIILFGDRAGYRAYVARSMLVEKISDLLVVLDERRRVIDMNRAAAVALGVSLESVQGQDVKELFSTWENVIEQVQTGRRGEIAHGGRSFELAVLPLEESAGELILWLRDITLHKQAEREHLVAANLARQANTAKDAYLAVMSHEIRSPLHSVLGFMRLLEATPLNSEQKEYVGHVLRDGDNLLAVINEILDFSKIEAGHINLAAETFDLRDEVTHLGRAMELQARGKGLMFSCRVMKDVPAFFVGDKVRVMQILRNLIVNAIKFTKEGSVRVQIDCAEPHTTTNCLLRFVVADTGIGIAAPDLDVLFQPFAQATPSIQGRYGGTGLGLAIAKRFSELMGGGIAVESAPGQGSTFTCLLRLTPSMNPAVAEDISTSPPCARATMRLLVVDDQPVNRRLLQIMLKRLGQDTVCVSSGVECLEILKKEHFDVVILDVEMPGMDGFEVSRRIREGGGLQPHLVALTAHASTDIREQCYAAGMDDYLSKPVTPLALKNAVEKAATALGGQASDE